MRFAFILGLLAVVPASLVAAFVSTTPHQRADPNVPLVGTWTLVSFESRTSTGEIRYPLGPMPTGQLLYDATGHVSAQLMNPDRPKFASADLTGGSDAEVRAAMSGYIAYYGSYTVDRTRGVVIHHVRGALFPNWVGSDQVRNFRLSGDRLTITTPPILIGTADVTTILVWERAR